MQLNKLLNTMHMLITTLSICGAYFLENQSKPSIRKIKKRQDIVIYIKLEKKGRNLVTCMNS